MLQKIKNLRLAPFVVGVLFVALLTPTLVSSYLLIENERQNQLQELEAFTKNISQLLASSLAIPLWEFRKESAMKAIEPILKDSRLIYVRVRDTQTNELFLDIENNKPIGNIINHSESIFNDTTKIGELDVGLSDFLMKEELQKTTNGYILLFLFQLFTSIAILLIAIYSKILMPIKKLTSQAKKLSQNDLHSKFEWNIDDEIGRLGKSFEYARESLLENIEQTRRQKERLSNIIEGTNAGTWEWNIQTGEAAFNERWAQMLGYSLDELGPISIEAWTKIAHPSDLNKSSTLIQEHLDGKSDFYECEVRVKHKDGSWIWILDRGKISKRDKNGKPLIISGTHQDITQSKQAQEALELAKTKAEEANRAKSQFLANMSHEIRTPMNAVTGLGEMLSLSNLDEEQRMLVAKINSSSKILLAIINDILDYSKIEAGKLELEHKEFIVQNLKTSLETLFAQKASQKGVYFELILDKNLPFSIMTDELRLTQALTNLTSNALKFTDNGQVSVHISLQKRVKPSKALLSFCVKDSGIGMNQTQLDKLFQPFTQADSSTTRRFGGTGLGLVITKSIIQALGGELTINSKDQVGTQVSFDLEFEVKDWLKREPEEQKTAQTIQYNRFLSGVEVLLVEDNEANQMVATLMLEKVGVVVDIANNGKEAVDKYFRNPNKYHLILMDLQMPVMNVYETSRAISKENPNIPIIALTAAAMIEDREKALKAGMNEHLSKPVSKSELYRVIAEFTNKQVQFHEKGKNESPNIVVDYSVLESITDSKEFVHKLLTKFQNQLTDGEFKNLILQIKKGDFNAPSLVHALKGVSGNLGAKEIFYRAQEIDKKYKQNSKITTKDYTSLEEAINNFLHHISDQTLNQAKSLESKTLSTVDFQNLVNEIKESLEESNFIPEERLNLLIENLRQKIPQNSLIQFQNYTDEFALDKALELLNKWLDSGLIR